MNTHRRRLTRAAFALALILSALSLMASSASATVTSITEGSLDWGLKESFRNYVVGTIAHGSITTDGGVTTNPDGSYKFPLTSGTYDDETGETILNFAGSVHFTGHAGILDMLVHNIRVQLSAEGQAIIVDAESNTTEGEPSSYSGVPLATLNIADPVAPTVAAGVTTWSSLATTLTQVGVPVFGGFYTAGTTLDPATITYTGPGGKPVPEEFSEPGAEVWSAIGHANANFGPDKIYFDPINHAVHVVGAERIVAYDSNTLAYLGAVEPPAGSPFTQKANAFDPETGTVFVASGSEVYAYTFKPETAVYQRRTVPVTPYSRLLYNTATDRLFSIDAKGAVFTPVSPMAVDAADWDPVTISWTHRAYQPLNTGGPALFGAVTTADGNFVVAYAPQFAAPTMNRQSLYSLSDDGSALTPTEIPGTGLGPVTPAVGAIYGWLNLAADNIGNVAAGVFGFAVATSNAAMLKLEPTTDNPSGFRVAGGQPQALPFVPATLSYDQTSGDLYLQEQNRLAVLRDGETAATIEADEQLVSLGGGDSAAYAIEHDAIPYQLVGFRPAGVTPEVETDPQDESVTLSSSRATAEVTFTAAATGSPAPAVRWQRRGEFGGWKNIAGADGDTLSWTARPEDDGLRFRAIFTNKVGEVATDVANLSVGVHDTEAPVVTILAPLNGSSTADATTTLAFLVSDNSDTSPQCDKATGSKIALNLGANTISVFCVDSYGNVSMATAVVTRTPAVPEVTPTAPGVSAATGTSRVRASASGVRLKVANVRCPAGTCELKLPTRVTLKVGKKRYKVAIDGPDAIAEGRTGRIVALLPAKAVKALKRKKATLSVRFTTVVGGQSYGSTAKVKLAGR